MLEIENANEHYLEIYKIQIEKNKRFFPVKKFEQCTKQICKNRSENYSGISEV